MKERMVELEIYSEQMKSKVAEREVANAKVRQTCVDLDRFMLEFVCLDDTRATGPGGAGEEDLRDGHRASADVPRDLSP